MSYRSLFVTLSLLILQKVESLSLKEQYTLESNPTGLLNEGKGCFGHCGRTAGDCDYCGTGQCCRKKDYNDDVEGCELASDVVGSRCGHFRGEIALKNEGLSCWGHCSSTAGNCSFCGTGQCCRLRDGQDCIPGCESAVSNWILDGPGSQCGAFSDPDAICDPPTPAPTPVPTSPPTLGPMVPTDSNTNPTDIILNDGQNCASQCGITNGEQPGNCSYCGTGQCCTTRNWLRGVPGCELAENAGTTAICGAFNSPRPEPEEFRLGEPQGIYATTSYDTGASNPQGMWIKDIDVTGDDSSDHAKPEYTGDGGQPWSKFEMQLVRDLLLFEMRRASRGRDELSASKFVRLPFHDCLLYTDGTGGCDGCLNWEGVGFRFQGRVENRNFEDNERILGNNGLGDPVRFLEYIYTLDMGKTWGSGCWTKPASVTGGSDAQIGDTQSNPILVNSTDQCAEECRKIEECKYFTVPHSSFLATNSQCRLFNGQGSIRKQSGSGRLIAGDARCASESWSLESRGISRADLWAFASLVGVEEGIQRHNWACDGDRRSPHNGPIMCTQFEGEEQCHISVHRPFIFKTGRKDCVTSLIPSYQSEKKENIPDDHFNGTMTVRFMEDNFKFSAKDTVTIMGAHTVGTFHQMQTAHKYVWTTDFQAFNNQYYRNIAGREDWFFDDDDCTKVGDAWNNKGHAVWIAKMNQAYRSGGPIQWIQKKVVCPNCAAQSYNRGGRHADRLAQDRDCCLNNVPEGAQCRPDNWYPTTNISRAVDRDNDFSDGCEYSHFIFGVDEAALGSDMGLMYKFNVDIRGFPSGCQGLDTFYPSGNRFSDWTCGIDGRPWFVDPSLAWDDPNLERETTNDWTSKACPANCPKQDYKYPGDELTLADHVERYADDQDAWIQEFIPVMEKMIQNGYEDSELVISFSG